MKRRLEQDLAAELAQEMARVDRRLRLGPPPYRAKYRRGQKPKFRALTRRERIHGR